MKIKIPFFFKKNIDYIDGLNGLEGLEPHCPSCDIVSDVEIIDIPEGEKKIEQLLKLASKYQKPYLLFFGPSFLLLLIHPFLIIVPFMLLPPYWYGKRFLEEASPIKSTKFVCKNCGYTTYM